MPALLERRFFPYLKKPISPWCLQPQGSCYRTREGKLSGLYIKMLVYQRAIRDVSCLPESQRGRSGGNESCGFLEVLSWELGCSWVLGHAGSVRLCRACWLSSSHRQGLGALLQPPWQHGLARAALQLLLDSMQLKSQRSETLCNGGHL